jgi:O-antigen/teichoic acid export membrane protein
MTLKYSLAGDKMNHNIIGAAVAMASGLIVAFANYLLSKKVLIKAPEKYSLVTVVRQILQVGFLVLVYLIGTKTNLAEPVYLLVGAVIGITAPMIFFTKKLLYINNSKSNNKKEKEAESDG